MCVKLRDIEIVSEKRRNRLFLGQVQVNIITVNFFNKSRDLTNQFKYGCKPNQL